MDDLSQFKDLFFQSANVHIAAISKLLDNNVENGSPNLDVLHLHFHTLKGEVLAMQYLQFGAFITALEKYVKSMKEANGALSSKDMLLIIGAVKDIDEILGVIRSENLEPEGISDKTEMLIKNLGVSL